MNFIEFSEKSKQFFSELKAQIGVVIEDENIRKSFYNIGNRYRIAKLFEKASRGESITLAFFGGSITEGAAAYSKPADESGIKTAIDTSKGNIYPYWVTKWFEDVFSCKVKVVNAGIGATDTPFATHRMNPDVLAHNPDLVILEWCVNDGSEFLYKQGTYESMARKFISSDSAIIMLSLCTQSGSTSQSLHEPIAKKYDVPMLSYKDAFFAHPSFRFFSNDTVHPNMIGHPIIGLMLCEYLERVLSSIDKAEKADFILPNDTVHPDAMDYDGADVYDISDIADGKYENIELLSHGSFKKDKEQTGFGFRKYFAFTANSDKEYKPMKISIKNCKTLFLEIYRNTVNIGSDFEVKINGEVIRGNTFTCMHGVDNNQPEWDYHWATERICRFSEGRDILLEIIPKISAEHPNSFVRIYSLLIS